MAEKHQSSTSSPPPSAGLSSFTSDDQPARRKRKSRKRRHEDDEEELDITGFTAKRSRITRVETVSIKPTRSCYACLIQRMDMMDFIDEGHYQRALACTKLQHDCSVNGEEWVDTQETYFLMVMSGLVTDKKKSCETLGMDYADAMMCLLSKRIVDFNRFQFLHAYLKPGYTEPLLKLVDKHSTNLKHKLKLLRVIIRCAEDTMLDLLKLIHQCVSADEPDKLQQYRRELAHLVQVLPVPLKEEYSPGRSKPWCPVNTGLRRTPIDVFCMFATAVVYGLVQEAKLFFEAGFVHECELLLLSNRPDIKEMMSDEKDQSEMAVFLRKVFKQPRSLQSMALQQVSKLVGQQDILGREDRVRQLPVARNLHDDLLHRHLLIRYRHLDL